MTELLSRARLDEAAIGIVRKVGIQIRAAGLVGVVVDVN
jgi:hypothetical protein